MSSGGKYHVVYTVLQRALAFSFLFSTPVTHIRLYIGSLLLITLSRKNHNSTGINKCIWIEYITLYGCIIVYKHSTRQVCINLHSLNVQFK